MTGILCPDCGKYISTRFPWHDCKPKEDEMEILHFVKEASELGWPPGSVPDNFYYSITPELKVHLVLQSTQTSRGDDEEIESWFYSGPGVSLTVFND